MNDGIVDDKYIPLTEEEYRKIVEGLVKFAAIAIEVFGEDELERYAAELRKKENNERC